ncbi:hypothetical protein [Rhodopirellula baltica]|nr:hypothetical protein [Rhodopirellula baltica]
MMDKDCKQAYELLAEIREWEDSADPWSFADAVRVLLDNPKFVSEADFQASALIRPFFLSEFLKEVEGGSDRLACLVGAIVGVIAEASDEQEL